MSFCRITGRARGLPKPNYFPLLPPISPADARRFCRITGKSYGLPSHHYIPVVTVRSGRRQHCHITASSEGNEHHHYLEKQGAAAATRRHVVIADYRYVFPVLDDGDEQQRPLTAVLATKTASQADARYVYTVAERSCGLVFPARLEAAVRDGDVRDVMLAKDSDTVLFRMRHGKNVTVEVRDLDPDEAEWFEGEGPTEEVVRQREKEDDEKGSATAKKKRKRTGNLSSVTRLFEEREREAEVAEEKMAQFEMKKAKMVELKMTSPAPGKAPGPVVGAEELSWRRFDEKQFPTDAHLYLAAGKGRETVGLLAADGDMETALKEAAAEGATPVTVALPRPVPHEAELVDLSQSLPGIVPPHTALSPTDVAPLEPTAAVAPLRPLLEQPPTELQDAIRALDPVQLDSTDGIKEVFEGGERSNLLPGVQEIPGLVASLDSGVEAVICDDKGGRRVQGLMLDIAAAQRFVAGQKVDTPSGPVFVPGQTLQTPAGRCFVPGFTVMTPEGPALVPGQKVDVREEDGSLTPVFVAGQTLATREGEKFVAGQVMNTPEGPRFVPGQTVFTPDGPKFVPGQVVHENQPDGTVATKFVAGQTVMTPEGPQFVPGQTVSTSEGETLFIPGQSVQMENEWEFVPGQTVKTAEGERKFVAGQTLITPTGPKFIPGRTVGGTDDTPLQFVPGISVKNEDGTLSFLPGKTIDTAEGPKFVEGQVLQTSKGLTFVPGKTDVSEDGVTVRQFAVAKSVEDVILSEKILEGLPVSASTIGALTMKEKESIYGHMVQTTSGVEFFPGNASGLPAGKVVPGKLVHGDNGEVRFVPGIFVKEEGKFVPGQVVLTEKGEQFVPGQVVETRDGPKFVPGQVVETRTGPKFVPGQTVETPEGPRFVPGQIVETKAGPTFIPGQVISTPEEGSRFVPGQVVDTADGPRFVPGRVVETDEHVAFIPGQVVETKDGPRFVAPDLQHSPEGGFEFSVQGFEVTPEELRLLRPPAVHVSGGEAAVDARMLRQLSDAGMAVGRQVPAELPEVAVREDSAGAQVVHHITNKLALSGAAAVRMADVLASVAKLSGDVLESAKGAPLDAASLSEKVLESMRLASTGAVTVGSETVKEFIRSVVSAVVVTASQKSETSGESSRDAIIAAIGPVFDELLKDVYDLEPDNRQKAAEAFVESLHHYLVSPSNVRSVRESAARMLGAEAYSNVAVLEELLRERNMDAVVEKVTAVLRSVDGTSRQQIVGDAFKQISHGNPELVGQVLDKVSESLAQRGAGELQEATATLQKAIVKAVRESSEQQLQQQIRDADTGDDRELRALVTQAIGLARALDMHDAAAALAAVLSDPRITHALAGDVLALDVLRRLTVMRQLAQRRPSFARALSRLQPTAPGVGEESTVDADEDSARCDPYLRELVRQSAALTDDRAAPPLQSSHDVPAALLLAGNWLAIEDFVSRRPWSRPGAPILIIKQGLQAVVPREAARAVLTGEVAYTLLDETGVSHFEPLNVFSALRMPARAAAHRFSMYSAATLQLPAHAEEEEATTTLTAASSTDDVPHAQGQGQAGVPWRSLASSDTVTSTSRPFYTASEDVRRGSCGDSIWSVDTQMTELSDLYVATQDFTAEEADGLSLKKGDIVEIIDSGDRESAK
ncbi:uncharacterized protein LOC124593677 [Schistocerca americana]|uniref:uncharacterized protein LOC124593677 n=1 Tax=Schistocerca americana TaxID=7009 RepID=UPI001F4FAABD|nr:uncharacterized protein LOC124593677 [Schistocerca americana]